MSSARICWPAVFMLGGCGARPLGFDTDATATATATTTDSGVAIVHDTTTTTNSDPPVDTAPIMDTTTPAAPSGTTLTDTSPTFDTAPIAVDTGPPSAVILDYMEYPQCDAVGDLVFYAETSGLTNSASLVNVWEQGAVPPLLRWNEEHDLPSIGFDQGGVYDLLEQGLQHDGLYDRNVSTLFGCDVNGDVAHQNVYAMRVYDIDGNYADCGIFHIGVPDGVQQVFDGDTDDLTPVTRRAEINPADCVVWATY